MGVSGAQNLIQGQKESPWLRRWPALCVQDFVGISRGKYSPQALNLLHEALGKSMSTPAARRMWLSWRVVPGHGAQLGNEDQEQSESQDSDPRVQSLCEDSPGWGADSRHWGVSRAGHSYSDTSPGCDTECGTDPRESGPLFKQVPNSASRGPTRDPEGTPTPKGFLFFFFEALISVIIY